MKDFKTMTTTELSEYILRPVTQNLDDMDFLLYYIGFSISHLSRLLTDIYGQKTADIILDKIKNDVKNREMKL